jgi:hypothetical protein
MVHNMNPANWTMPQWKMPNFRSILPGQEEKTRVVKKKDGLLSETKAVATNSWNKTKEVMDPQKLNPARLFRPASSTTPSKSSEPEQPGFFSRLFTPAPEESKPKSPNEFLKGDRPGF